MSLEDDAYVVESVHCKSYYRGAFYKRLAYIVYRCTKFSNGETVYIRTFKDWRNGEIKILKNPSIVTEEDACR